MALLVPHAALRVYDALKFRPGASPRDSGARDAGLIARIIVRIGELIGVYRLTTQEVNGQTYLFWTELDRLIQDGNFDDLLEGL